MAACGVSMTAVPRPRASGYFEADLAELLKPGNEDGLRVFHLLFRRDSFTLQKGAKTTFLEAALAEGRRYEERVAQDLSGVVFARVFPSLVKAIEGATGRSLAKIREAALIFLYRLLFVLYAEDRGLLPVNDSRYDDYGLRKRVRDDIARRMADKDTFFGSRHQLLRPPDDALQAHRQGRHVHRPAALQWGAVRF